MHQITREEQIYVNWVHSMLAFEAKLYTLLLS